MRVIYCCTVNPQNDNIIFMVGHDATRVEAAKFSLKRPSNNARIIDNICENIASNHMPYSWIESHCDDIMDEYGGNFRLCF